MMMAEIIQTRYDGYDNARVLKVKVKVIP